MKIDNLIPVDTEVGISLDSFYIYSVKGPIESICKRDSSFKTTVNKCIFWDSSIVAYV